MHGREFGPKNYYCPESFADGDWRKGHAEFNGLQPLSSVGSHNYSRDVKKIHDKFRDYFWGVGSVPWPWEHLSRTDPFNER